MEVALRKTGFATVLCIFIFILLFSHPADAKSLYFFNDVKSTSWYYGSVYRLSSDGIIAGYSEDTFAPNDRLTRAMFVSLLGRLSRADIDAYPSLTGFADVPTDSWYAKSVSWAYTEGLAYGVSDSLFNPNGSITREELATMVARYLSRQEKEIEPIANPVAFADAASVHSWAKDAVETMRLTGLIVGDEKRCFNPRNTASRAEAASILCRIIDSLGLEETRVRHYLPDMTYIIHAAGAIDGNYYTNSAEALQQAYNRGCRAIELDFNFTADGKLVCVHDWNIHLFPYITNNVAPTYADYLNMRVYDRYTPIDLAYVIDFLRAHPDIFIVTDVKTDNTEVLPVIMKSAPDLAERFIVQIYSPEEYDAVYKLGFPNIILTFYHLPPTVMVDTAQHIAFSSNHDLVGFTFDRSLCSYPGFVPEMLKTGVHLFTHTVNDKAMQDAYFAQGISGVYTDNIQ